jgi:hypothetical protein
MANVGTKSGHAQLFSETSAKRLVPTKSLSATGSKNAPNALTAFNRRAAHPSAKSVKATTIKATAGMNDSTGCTNINHATTIANTQRATVNAFGTQVRVICSLLGDGLIAMSPIGLESKHAYLVCGCLCGGG